MDTSMRWTTKDLDALPLGDGSRYEIIAGTAPAVVEFLERALADASLEA
jgi:hypothetical protein